MAISSAQVTVGTTAVALTVAESGGSRVVVSCTGADAAVIGPADVTASSGLPLAAGATLTVDIDPGDVLFAVRETAATVDTTVAVLRT